MEQYPIPTKSDVVAEDTLSSSLSTPVVGLASDGEATSGTVCAGALVSLSSAEPLPLSTGAAVVSSVPGTVVSPSAAVVVSSVAS